jgi:hypothetical protein
LANGVTLSLAFLSRSFRVNLFNMQISQNILFLFQGISSFFLVFLWHQNMAIIITSNDVNVVIFSSIDYAHHELTL